MNMKLIISILAASVWVLSGCSQQARTDAGAGSGAPVPGANQNAGSGGQYGGSGGGGSGAVGNRAGGRGPGSGNTRNGSAGGGTGSGLGNGRGSANGFGGGTGRNNGPGGFGSGSGYGGNTQAAYTPADLRNPGSILAQRIIYFDYNQSAIQPRYYGILDAHASLLADFPQLNIRLEGHADERGSREYNVALSERRAFSVLDYLKVKGVNAGQVDVVGYGEEIPATFGQGESAWSQNRRVEIIYAGE